MKHKWLSFCVLLGSVGALQASTTFTITGDGAGVQDGGYDISPYTGTLGSPSQNVELFCDDFNDHVSVPSTYNVNVNYANNATANPQTATSARFSASDYYNTAMPSGTTLYEEMAWLFTQMMKVGQSAGNDEGIQEAVWHMTSTATQPTNSDGTGFITGTLTNAQLTTDYAAGDKLSYQEWIQLAQADYATTSSSFQTPNYGGWMILTDASSNGNKSGSGNQEFLAYYTSSGVPLSATPEPATFGLIGSALLFGALIAKRRKSAAAQKA